MRTVLLGGGRVGATAVNLKVRQSRAGTSTTEKTTHRQAKPSTDANSKPYLGDRAVVWGILAQMLERAGEDPQSSEAEIAKAVKIITGQDDAYQPVGPWNSEGIGNWIRDNMNGVPTEGGAAAAVEYALAHAPEWTTSGA
jgi:hypothetical protein